MGILRYPGGFVHPADAAPVSNRRKFVSDQPLNPSTSPVAAADPGRSLRKWQAAVVGLLLCLAVGASWTWWYVSQIDPRGKTIQADNGEPVRIQAPDGSITEVSRERDPSGHSELRRTKHYDKNGQLMSSDAAFVFPDDAHGTKPLTPDTRPGMKPNPLD